MNKESYAVIGIVILGVSLLGIPEWIPFLEFDANNFSNFRIPYFMIIGILSLPKVVVDSIRLNTLKRSWWIGFLSFIPLLSVFNFFVLWLFLKPSEISMEQISVVNKDATIIGIWSWFGFAIQTLGFIIIIWLLAKTEEPISLFSPY